MPTGLAPNEHVLRESRFGAWLRRPISTQGRITLTNIRLRFHGSRHDRLANLFIHPADVDIAMADIVEVSKASWLQGLFRGGHPFAWPFKIVTRNGKEFFSKQRNATPG
jgi:hypothetical protein